MRESDIEPLLAVLYRFVTQLYLCKPKETCFNRAINKEEPMNKSKLAIAVAFAVTLAACGTQTQTQTQSNLPAGVKLIEQSAPSQGIHIPYKKYQLDNGLTVIVHEDNSDPLVHVDVTKGASALRAGLFQCQIALLLQLAQAKLAVANIRA